MVGGVTLENVKDVKTDANGLYIDIPKRGMDRYHGHGCGVIEVDDKGQFKRIAGYWGGEVVGNLVNYQGNDKHADLARFKKMGIPLVVEMPIGSGNYSIMCNFSNRKALFY